MYCFDMWPAAQLVVYGISIEKVTDKQSNAKPDQNHLELTQLTVKGRLTRNY